MKRNALRAIALFTFALGVVLPVAAARRPKHWYPSMTPLDQYTMERSAEISLARSAAPVSIS